MNKKAKFWLFFSVGICIYIPFFLISIIVQMFLGTIVLFVSFLLQCYFLYHFVYKGAEPKYPMVPPEGRMDIYSPRTNIPRPVYEDMQRYPEFFERKKRKYDRTRKVKKKG